MERSAPPPPQLLEIAIEVARNAAATAFRMRTEGVSVAATKSTVTDVVTA
ncbi:inositol monophosphatase, partial [Escherichia coli]|nr:inositol monophosphatase [Escherichia coli]